jgi:hypothetical protein
LAAPKPAKVAPFYSGARVEMNGESYRLKNSKNKRDPGAA